MKHNRQLKEQTTTFDTGQKKKLQKRRRVKLYPFVPMKPSDYSELELLHKKINCRLLGKDRDKFEQLSGPISEFFYYVVRNMFSIMEFAHSE